MRRFAVFLCFLIVLHPLPAYAVQKDVAQWLAYRKGAPGITFNQISRFMKAHPHWPAQKTLRREAEKRLPESLPQSQIIAWFDVYPPLTASAMDRYVHALIASGNVAKARPVLRKWWEDASLSREQQKQIFAKYKSYLNSGAHKARMNALLHRGEYTNANAIADVLGGGYPALARARAALARGNSDVNGLISRVPSFLQSDPGLLYERLRWRRKQDLNDGAIALLARAPAYDRMHSPAAWWRERHIIARRLIEKKQYTKAYSLVRKHKQKNGLSFAQAEWLAGWLALRFANKPWPAFEHFEKLYNNVDSPISKGRAAYWAGLASEKLKRQDIAQKWYQSGAQYNNTFYGQLASAKIRQSGSIHSGSRPGVSSEAKTSFYRRDLVKAAKFLANTGMKKEAKTFLYKLREDLKTPQDYILASSFSKSLGLTDLEIRFAQDAHRKYGFLLPAHAYPIRSSDMRSVSGVEWALIHALIRQESRFDQYAISPAGARGLMQLMPATARETARKIGIAHQKAWLTSKPAHNIRLGSSYIKRMLDRYDGNYVLAAAAYNAGPGRVDRWLKTYGDPRTRQVDLIDWIELIPIYETRNYAQRVMEAVYVYRHYLVDVQPKSSSILHVAIQ